MNSLLSVCKKKNKKNPKLIVSYKPQKRVLRHNLSQYRYYIIISSSSTLEYTEYRQKKHSKSLKRTQERSRNL